MPQPSIGGPDIGDRIRVRREQLGLTQEDLAKKIRVFGTQISKYESGGGMTYLRLRLIAKALDMSLRELQHGAGEEAVETVAIETRGAVREKMRIASQLREIADNLEREAVRLSEKYAPAEEQAEGDATMQKVDERLAIYDQVKDLPAETKPAESKKTQLHGKKR